MQPILQLTRNLPIAVTLDEAKAHLGLMTNHDDARVNVALQAANDYVEQYLRRSCRSTTEVVEVWGALPYVLYTRINPLLSDVVLTLVDSDGVESVVDAADYIVTKSTDGMSSVVFGEMSQAYAEARVSYTAGYLDGKVPESIRQSILLKTGEIFGDLDDKQSATAHSAAHSLAWMYYGGSYR